MKLIHKILLGVSLVVVVIGIFGYRTWRLDQKIEQTIDGRYYKWSDDSSRIDFIADDGEYTINWTKTDSKKQTISNYQYTGSINTTNLQTSRSTKQEYQDTKPQDSIKATNLDFVIDEYDSDLLKIHAKSGNDTKTYTLTADGVITVEQQDRSVIQWIVDAFKTLWNRIVNLF